MEPRSSVVDRSYVICRAPSRFWSRQKGHCRQSCAKHPAQTPQRLPRGDDGAGCIAGFSTRA